MAKFEVALRDQDSGVSTWSMSVPIIFTMVHNKGVEVDDSEYEEALNTDSGGDDEGIEDAESDAAAT